MSVAQAQRKTAHVSLLNVGAEAETLFHNLEWPTSPYEVWSAHAPSKGPAYSGMYISTEPLTIPDYTGINSTLLLMRQEIVEIKGELAHQKTMIEQILSHVAGSGLEIEIEELDDSAARERILKFFNEHAGSLFYDQIAESLKLPLRQTVEICNQLEQEELIGEPSTK
ncbi:MAG: hypothetical protein WB341_07800 [Terracidiphilus sp.]